MGRGKFWLLLVMDPLKNALKMLWKLVVIYFAKKKKRTNIYLLQVLHTNFKFLLRINWIKYINHWLQHTFSSVPECYHSLWKNSLYSSVPFPPFALMLFMNIRKVRLKILVFWFVCLFVYHVCFSMEKYYQEIF